jgi:hypothetical protein
VCHTVPVPSVTRLLYYNRPLSSLPLRSYTARYCREKSSVKRIVALDEQVAAAQARLEHNAKVRGLSSSFYPPVFSLILFFWRHVEK